MSKSRDILLILGFPVFFGLLNIIFNLAVGIAIIGSINQLFGGLSFSTSNILTNLKWVLMAGGGFFALSLILSAGIWYTELFNSKKVLFYTAITWSIIFTILHFTNENDSENMYKIIKTVLHLIFYGAIVIMTREMYLNSKENKN